MVCLDDKPCAVRKRYVRPLKSRRPDGRIRQPGTYRIKAQIGKHIPCRHLARIIISRKSSRLIHIFRIADEGYQSLGFGWHSGIIEQISYLVTRFVSMPITVLTEEGIEFHDKTLSSTQHLHQSADIVRHIPCIM